MVIAGCGGGETQDANEPEGEFPVEVTEAKFPTKQRLAQTSYLVLGVENTGDEEVPELAFTISTVSGEADASEQGGADGSFKIRSDQPNLANPNRAVWILENKFPREWDAEKEKPEPAPAGLSGAFRAQTNTYGFGPLPAGEERQVVWQLTAVQPGTYTVNYRVAAGLDGNAVAVTGDGGEVKGEFVVTITDKPPKATVNDAGKVVVQD